MVPPSQVAFLFLVARAISADSNATVDVGQLLENATHSPVVDMSHVDPSDFNVTVLGAAPPPPPSAGGSPNVWNFKIATEVIGSFPFNGHIMSMWEDATSHHQRLFYVTPITEFVPESSKCEFNPLLSSSHEVSYKIQLWSERLQAAAVDRLKQMNIVASTSQIQPLPFYQVRVIWNNPQNLKKASLVTTWQNNLQQSVVREFRIMAEDQTTCELLATTMKAKPAFFTSSIALEYTLTASSVASKTLTVKAEHFLNSKLVAALKSMDVQSPERFMSADDANQLVLQVTDTIVATQVTSGDYVGESDMVSLKDLVQNALKLSDIDATFTNKSWDSVYWDPVYARPDKITKYLNKILTIDKGKKEVKKSGEFGVNYEAGVDIAGIGGLNSKFGANGKMSFEDLNEWLKQNNYDVEIQGEIFIPKSRNLKRLNLAELNRKQDIVTKNVQLHHVDAPGVLPVTVGSLAPIESQDIASIRKNVDDLQKFTEKVQKPYCWDSSNMLDEFGLTYPWSGSASDQNKEQFFKKIDCGEGGSFNKFNHVFVTLGSGPNRFHIYYAYKCCKVSP